MTFASTHVIPQIITWHFVVILKHLDSPLTMNILTELLNQPAYLYKIMVTPVSYSCTVNSSFFQVFVDMILPGPNEHRF